MTNVRMPNGDVVSFPDDMPKEQIKSLIASKFPEVAQQQAPAEKPKNEPFNYTFLPIAVDEKGGISPGVPGFISGMIDSAKDAYSAPYRAYTGELPMTDETGRTSDAAIAEGFNLATWATPTSIASGTGKQIARNAAKISNVAAPKEEFGVFIVKNGKWEEAMVTGSRAEAEREKMYLSKSLGVNAEVFKRGPSSANVATTKQATNLPVVNGRPPSEGAMVAQAAQDLGVTLPRAVTSDNAAVNQLGKTVANIPVVGQPLRKASRNAIEQMDTAAKRVQDDLGTGSKDVAGNRIRQDMATFAKVDEPAKVTELYSKVDSLVDPAARIPLSETQRIAQNINARRSASRLEGSSAVDFVGKALQAKEGMSYEEIKGLRTAIGELKKNKSELAARKIADSELDAIYNGLSTDLKNAVKAGGGNDALRAFEEANSRAKTFARDKEALNKVIGGGSDENITSRLIALAGNTSRANIKDLALAKSKVSKETWDELASSALQDMGRDASGNLTPDRFVTSWGKMSESGKKLLFSPDHRKALDDLATVSSRFKKLNEYANPSGTGQTVMTGALGGAAFVDPITALKVAIPGYVTAKFLASPASSKAVADYAKAYELAAKAPGQTSQNMLAKRAQELALIAANGNERAASNLAARLATVQQTAATDQSQEEVGRPVGNPEPAQVDQKFNDAYLQGRAF